MAAPPVIVKPEQAVPLVSGHFNFESDVVALSNGRSVVTWSDWVFDNANGQYVQHVFARVIDSGGNQIGSTIQVDTFLSQTGLPTNHTPVATALSDGGFVIAFTRDYSASDTDVIYQRYNANGVAVSGNTIVQNSGNLEAVGDTVGLAGGGWVVSYTDLTAGSGNIFADFYNSAGTRIANDVVIGVNDASEQIAPKMAALANGNVVIAYTSTSGTDKNVLYRIMNASGGVVLADQIANRVTTGSGGAVVNQVVGSVTALSNGGFAIAYTSEYFNGGGGLATNDHDVFVELFNAAGTWQSTVTIDAAGFMQYEPSIVGLPDGTFSVTYADREPESGNAANIHTRIYTNTGEFLGEVDPLNATTAGSQLVPQSAVLPDGRLITTWTDFGPTGNVDYAIVDSRTRVSDFGRDARSDILWRGAGGEVVIWNMNGNQVLGGGFISSQPGSFWTVAGTGDYNSDGRADILWRGADGGVVIWNMNGTQVLGGGFISSQPGAYWTVAGTGDYNGDGNADILWRGNGGDVAIWNMNGTQVIGGGALSSQPGSYWTVAGSADFNGDGKSDILWRNSDGGLAIWNMNGNQLIGGGLLSSQPGSYWSVAGTGDFNGDGKADIVWRNSDGGVAIWNMDGNQVLSGGFISSQPGSYWTIAGTRDFNGDGRSDILWRNSDGGLAIWNMNGTQLIGGGLLSSQPGTYWSVAKA